MVRRFTDSLLFTGFFIASCAVLMTHQTALLFKEPLPLILYFFVFCGTVCSYNFHWALNPADDIFKGLSLGISRKVHGALSLLGLSGAAVASFALTEHWLALASTVVLAFLYSAPKIPHPLFVWLRRVAVGKTIFSTLR